MEQQPTKLNQLYKTPLAELLIEKCWKPDCRKIATCMDGSGWKWCDAHLDQEKVGGPLHSISDVLDYDYYLKKIRETLKNVSFLPDSK